MDLRHLIKLVCEVVLQKCFEGHNWQSSNVMVRGRIACRQLSVRAQLQVESLPHTFTDHVLDCVIGGGQRVDIPLLVIEHGRLSQVVNNYNKDDSGQTRHTRDYKTLFSLLVEDGGVLLAFILHVNFGGVRCTAGCAILTCKIYVVVDSETTLILTLARITKVLLKVIVAQVVFSAFFGAGWRVWVGITLCGVGVTAVAIWSVLVIKSWYVIRDDASIC